MPDVVGLPIPEAVRRIEEVGLTVATIRVVDYSKLGKPGAGDVLRQVPAAGVQVAPGAEVSLAVTAIHSTLADDSPPVPWRTPPPQAAKPPAVLATGWGWTLLPPFHT